MALWSRRWLRVWVAKLPDESIGPAIFTSPGLFFVRELLSGCVAFLVDFSGGLASLSMGAGVFGLGCTLAAPVPSGLPHAAQAPRPE